MNDSNGKIGGFTSDWVNSQTKNLSNEKKIEEKHEVVSSTKKETEEKKSEVEQLTIKKKEYEENDLRNEMIQYAYNIGWLDLVLMMECENSTRNMYRQSEVVKNWRREPSYWLCMIDRDFHPEIIDDPRFRSDRKRQIETCNRLYTWGTKFYWPSRIVKGQRCSEYVKQRFTLT